MGKICIVEVQGRHETPPEFGTRSAELMDKTGTTGHEGKSALLASALLRSGFARLLPPWAKVLSSPPQCWRILAASLANSWPDPPRALRRVSGAFLARFVENSGLFFWRILSLISGSFLAHFGPVSGAFLG